jgi:hypothetical protein
MLPTGGQKVILGKPYLSKGGTLGNRTRTFPLSQRGIEGDLQGSRRSKSHAIARHTGCPVIYNRAKLSAYSFYQTSPGKCGPFGTAKCAVRISDWVRPFRRGAACCALLGQGKPYPYSTTDGRLSIDKILSLTVS